VSGVLIAVKLSEGLNFSATFRSEAEEKFKVNLKSVLCSINGANSDYQEQESEGNLFSPKPKAHLVKNLGGHRSRIANYLNKFIL